MSTVADVIAARREQIVQRWADVLVGAIFPRALDRETVIDSLREFLDEMAARLRGEHAARRAGARPDNIAVVHAAQRFRLGADIGSLVREYAHLRAVLFELVEAETPAATPHELSELSRHLMEGLADAASQYTAELQTQLRTQAARHVAFLAHELRGQLGSVRVAFALLQRGDAAVGARATEKIERGITRLAQLIDDALVEARLAQDVELHPEDVAVEAFLRDIVDDVLVEAEAKGLAVHSRIDGTPPRLRADVKVLWSALSNLVRNAVKFSRPGGYVHVTAKESGSHVVLEVEDSCGGIDATRVAQLFDPFVQIGADRSGFGLGLALAKQAAQAHGGTVRVHDVPERGCVFAIDLPIVPSPPGQDPESMRTA